MLESAFTNTSLLSSKAKRLQLHQSTMKTPQIRRYCIRHAEDGTARLAIEITPPLQDVCLRPEILREDQDRGCSRSCRDGILPHDCVSSALVVIVHVRPQDVIIIGFYDTSGILVRHDRFQISKSFIPEPREFEKSPTPDKVETPQNDLPPGTGTLVHMHPGELKKLFSDHHPKWLRSRLDAVLDSWEMQLPMYFLRVAPRARIARNLPLLIHHDPNRALSEFQKLLNVEKLQHCIQHEPFAAVKHAFVRIPRTIRIGLVRQFSTYVLEHHLDRLNERELEAASCADARTAFPLRHFVDGRRHAILLANSYPSSFFMMPHSHDPDFMAEVKNSVLEHPRIWRSAHHQSFAILFRALSSTLGVAFSGEELLTLTQKLGPALRSELRSFIGASI